MLIFLAFQQH